MEKLPLDVLVTKVASLGVPGLVLVGVIGATGYVGAAAVTTALAALGPGGMLGGVATLGVMSLVVDLVTQYGFEAVSKAVIKQLYKQGETADSIRIKIESYPLSKNLKLKLCESLNDIKSGGQ